VGEREQSKGEREREIKKCCAVDRSTEGGMGERQWKRDRKIDMRRKERN
jgi:hypothetical protein